MKKGLVIGVVVVLVAAFFALDLDQYLTLEQLKVSHHQLTQWLDQHPVKGSAAFFVFYIAVTSLSLPGATVMTIAGGALFGLWLGVLLVSFASTVGAMLAFLVGRYFLRDSVQNRFGDRLKAINRGMERDGAFYLFTLRLIPLFPFVVINLAMALTPIRTWTFYWVSQLVRPVPSLAKGRQRIMCVPVINKIYKLFPWISTFLVTQICADAVYVDQFDALSPAPGSPWELVRFDKNIPATKYSVVQWRGVDAIEAVAESSMALLARPVDVDLQQTPVLCWRWWVDAPLQDADMRTKAGDDYAARLYVTFDLPKSAMSFGTRAKLGFARRIYGGQVPDAAINYVWDNRYPVGTRQPNAYTERAQMVVLRSGAEHAKMWIEERRDLLRDLQQAFATEGELNLIAVASDTDNTGEQARALFADLHFVARDETCEFPQVMP